MKRYRPDVAPVTCHGWPGTIICTSRGGPVSRGCWQRTEAVLPRLRAACCTVLRCLVQQLSGVWAAG